jgi:transcriptional regulator with XRE-family HTH domain
MWQYQKFGEWLRMARVRRLPILSQQAIADRLDAPQSLVSRWEKEKPNTRPPSLAQCGRLADIFNVDFIELAKLCGQWDAELQERILVNLAAGIELSQAPLAQVA